MKKIFIILAFILSTLGENKSTMNANNLYIRQAIIFEFTKTNLIVVEDYYGNLWDFYAENFYAENWQQWEECYLLMDDNGTKNVIDDDKIIQVFHH